MEMLVVVDMQNDFLTGSLGNKETAAVLNNVCELVKAYKAENPAPVIYTMDTHYEDYLDTMEGKNLPVPHCIENTPGWELPEELKKAIGDNGIEVKKNTFGSKDLPQIVENAAKGINNAVIDKITLCGVCTDICVISNALLLKAFYPEVNISVNSKCCAGTTAGNHNNAIEAMKMCQIEII